MSVGQGELYIEWNESEDSKIYDFDTWLIDIKMVALEDQVAELKMQLSVCEADLTDHKSKLPKLFLYAKHSRRCGYSTAWTGYRDECTCGLDLLTKKYERVEEHPKIEDGICCLCGDKATGKEWVCETCKKY